jgi:hypothetical protein
MGNDNRRIILFGDGSGGSKMARKGRPLPLGWGVVALHDDGHHEIVRGITPDERKDASYFELYAFLEGVQYATNLGFAPEQISIYTDETRLISSRDAFHRENYVATETVDMLMEHLRYASLRFGSDAFDNAVTCLQRSNVSRLANAQFALYYHRAHYLANAGRMGADLSNPCPPFLSYDEWLESADFPLYMSQESAGRRGILGPFRPESLTPNGAVRWNYRLPFVGPPT